MKIEAISLGLLFCISYSTHCVAQSNSLEPIAVDGAWVSNKPLSVQFLLDPENRFYGVVVFTCVTQKQKIRLTALPGGAERVRGVMRNKDVSWPLKLTVSGREISDELTGGGGLLPSTLIDPTADWLSALGVDDHHFILSINDDRRYRIPTSSLISSVVGSCGAPTG